MFYEWTLCYIVDPKREISFMRVLRETKVKKKNESNNESKKKIFDFSVWGE